MEIRYLGTGAGAGIPEIFCSCPVCEKARTERGKNIRTRSQAILDGRVSIDFPVDVFSHCIGGAADMRAIGDILITHNHYDHFLPAELFSRPQGLTHPIRVWASAESGKPVLDTLNRWEEAYRSGKRVKTSDYEIEFHELRDFEPADVGGYTVHPLTAHHARNVGAMIYAIEKDGKALLWAHDTGELFDSVYEYIASSGLRFDFLSLDCTLARGERITASHMDIDQCADTVRRLREAGAVKDGAAVYLSHVGHLLRLSHEELEAQAAELGMHAAYDGMCVEI